MTAWGAIGHAFACPGCASLTRATLLRRDHGTWKCVARPRPKAASGGALEHAWGQTTLANRPTPLPLSDGERGRSITRARRDGTRPRRSELPRVLQGGLAGVAAGAEALVEAEAELGAGAGPGAGGEAGQSAGAGRVDRGQR